jgi:hypothetical protein
VGVVQDIITKFPDKNLRAVALQGITPYYSRGKGHNAGIARTARRSKNMDIKRASVKKHNKAMHK